VFLLFNIEWDLFDLKDVKEDLIFFTAIFLVLWSDFFKKQFFRDAICFIYIFYFVLETTSYIAVSSNFSSSYMYLLLESNKQELSEFTSSYFNVSIVLFLVVSILLFFVIRKKKIETFNKKYSLLKILGFVGLVVFLKFTGLIESNAYHNMVRGTYGYIDLQNSVKFNSSIKEEDISVETDNDVLVFVLGESTARGHMQIYGYNRATTPLLNTIKDSLYIFDNVISTDVFTLKSVAKILTSLDVNSEKENLFNLVEIFNAAGFNTYWLSNQRPISYHDNLSSKIASGAKMFKFYNHIIDKHAFVFDEVILPDFKNILKTPEKKVIFIRLIGTHFDYSNRYPKSFDVFNDKKANSKEEEISNNYDNAVLYNDFIVYSLINNLKQINKKSALLYVSDHGENVYDDGTDFFGRSEDILTKSMFEIPFLLWRSKDFELPLDFDYKSNRKFMSDHIYESTGHIFGVNHKSIDKKKSIFSESFIERERKVVNDVNYDEYFLKKNE
jgi:heptose-I-phosphate ethanolaminephosphotransferase